MNAPAIIPFAAALGKIKWASLVKGVSRARKSVGGMTRRRRSMGR